MDSETQVIAFGPFRLRTAERILERDGVPLALGSRALDILILLVERAGTVVSKEELLSSVWPNLTVVDSSIRVHVSGLRKALGEGQGGRYVANVPGRGYCFVAPVQRPVVPTAAPVLPAASVAETRRLPPRLTRMVGRDTDVRAVCEQLLERRFVTLLGPGGIGKTTVAVSVAHALLVALDGAVHFFDLGSLNDSALLPSALASAFGLLVRSNDPTPSLIDFLRDKRMLLVFDSCEHVIETAAALAEHIFEAAPGVQILATSREQLRAEGEHAYLLSALDTPPEGVALNAAQTLAFPAAQLFVERAAASAYGFELTDADAAIVAEICRKLDGIALAIELAAGRVGVHGIRETAALLDDRIKLLWRGRRTSPPRHQTLKATLDWSYELLPELERAVLRRLSVFMGAFTLEAASLVAKDATIDGAQVVDSVSFLVEKSLLSVRADGTTTRYQLLDTTRTYASTKLLDSGGAEAARRRHALYYHELLQGQDSGSPTSSRVSGLAGHAEHLGNVRAALEWTFSERGDLELGTALAGASTHLFLELSLLNECHRWTERALAALDDRTRGTAHEVTLQGALGVSLMFTRGNSEQALAAYLRGLKLAEELGDGLSHLRLLGLLHIFHERAGDFHSALSFANRGAAVAKDLGDPAGVAAAHSMLGISHHLMGNQALARSHLEAALAHPLQSERIKMSYFGFHYRNRARIALARTLWLLGYPDHARQAARETVDEATVIGHPVTICIALIWAVSVYHWLGDDQSAEQSIERFIAHANRHSLAPYYAVGLGVKGELSIRRGATDGGIEMLRRSLETLHADRYELLTTPFNISLAEGLATSGRFDEALTTVNDTIALVERNGDLFNMPELLRLKGEFLASLEGSQQAGRFFLDSLELAGAQSARSWELRTATSLARWRSSQDGGEARAALAETYARFKEGFDTADLKAAERLLDELDCPHRKV